jgi:hypothetical protein
VPAKIVLSRAVPIDPPICWAVLTVAEATPASLRSTPRVAVANEAENTQAAPAPAGMSLGSTWLA